LTGAANGTRSSRLEEVGGPGVLWSCLDPTLPGVYSDVLIGCLGPLSRLPMQFIHKIVKARVRTVLGFLPSTFFSSVDSLSRAMLVNTVHQVNFAATRHHMIQWNVSEAPILQSWFYGPQVVLSSFQGHHQQPNQEGISRHCIPSLTNLLLYLQAFLAREIPMQPHHLPVG